MLIRLAVIFSCSLYKQKKLAAYNLVHRYAGVCTLPYHRGGHREKGFKSKFLFNLEVFFVLKYIQTGSRPVMKPLQIRNTGFWSLICQHSKILTPGWNQEVKLNRHSITAKSVRPVIQIQDTAIILYLSTFSIAGQFFLLLLIQTLSDLLCRQSYSSCHVKRYAALQPGIFSET